MRDQIAGSFSSPKSVAPTSNKSAPLRPSRKGEFDVASREGSRIGPQGLAASGLAGFGIACLILWQWKLSGSHLILLFVCLTAAPMALVSVLINRTHLRATTGLTMEKSPADWTRYMFKFVGLCATFLGLAFLYWLLPEYHRQLYRPCWEAVALAGPPILALSFAYIAWVDRRMSDPEDAYYQMGLFVAGRWKKMRGGWVKEYLLTWAVKGFFLPLMIAGCARHLTILSTDGVDFRSFDMLFTSCINLFFTVDVLFGSIGYLLTLRVLDAHVRSTQETGLGWLSAIICYVPFSTALWPLLFEHPGIAGAQTWRQCFKDFPVIYISWGFLIMLLYAIYTWSTCSFGCRFSNLTNRGIVTTGPYRYLKHPAYVSKNLAWWCMYLPFLAHGTWDNNLRAGLLLALSNGVYALRAWTEERHLKGDSAYIEYAAWLDEHGLFALAKRPIVRFLRECK